MDEDRRSESQDDSIRMSSSVTIIREYKGEVLPELQVAEPAPTLVPTPPPTKFKLAVFRKGKTGCALQNAPTQWKDPPAQWKDHPAQWKGPSARPQSHHLDFRQSQRGPMQKIRPMTATSRTQRPSSSRNPRRDNMERQASKQLLVYQPLVNFGQEGPASLVHKRSTHELQ